MSALLLTACYDDSEMKSRLDKMDQRLTTVESQVASLNTQLTKLQGLMDGKLFISNIEDKEERNSCHYIRGCLRWHEHYDTDRRTGS